MAGGSPALPTQSPKLTEDVAVKFLNRTGKRDIGVAVFVENKNMLAAMTKFVAWHVIHTQNAASFLYPMETQVGALYNEDGVKMMSGPHDTTEGATWEFYQEIPNAVPFMREGRVSNKREKWVCFCSIDK